MVVSETLGNEGDSESRPLLKAKYSDDEFTYTEKRNIAYFIAGLMCFKFSFESLGGAVNLFVLDRIGGGAVSTLAILVICYGVSQSLGSMLVSQLIRVFRANRVIATAMILFAGLCSTYILLEFFSKGTLKTPGRWDPWLIFPIYISMGGCLGVMELIRRVIPSFIVGTNSEKLKKMDATVHIFYEVAGTAGAFASTPLIKYLGPVYATITIPPLFFTGSIFYFLVHHAAPVRAVETDYVPRHSWPVSTLIAVKRGVVNYFLTVKTGALIVFKNRHFVWLIFGYVIPLVLHRATENVLFSVFAKQILKDGSLSGILLGGSNFGELCGAALVLRFSRYIKTPLPWVRIDALALCVLWVFPFATSQNATKLAVGLIPAMMLLSGAWAAGDVSLLAYIQSQLPEEDDEEKAGQISPIGAVMGFLYASYVLISTGVVYGLGQLFDHFSEDPQQAFFWVSGVGMSAFSALIFSSTFIPKGSCKFNPNAEDLLASTIKETYAEGFTNGSSME